jgi:hypothetical protein
MSSLTDLLEKIPMIFLNILIRDLILFREEIKLNYKKNLLILITYLIFRVLHDNHIINSIIIIMFFLLSLTSIIKKNIAIDHYNRLKFSLIRYELLYIYQLISYIIIFIILYHCVYI